MIKAVFFDIDGTLVSFKTHKIPHSTKNALKELRQKGIKTFIATGRPFAAVNNLEDCEFDGYITMNGAYCMTADKMPIFKQAISQTEIQEMLNFQKNVMDFPCMAATQDGMYMNFVNADVEKVFSLINFPNPNMKRLDELAGKDVFQMVSFINEDCEKQLMSTVLTGCESARWNPLFTDIISKGISKQVGIDKVIGHYALDLNEVMAFGDGGNDLQMLAHVPHSVAMGNAVEQVKAAAAYVTTSVDDDGILNALKHFDVL